MKVKWKISSLEEMDEKKKEEEERRGGVKGGKEEMEGNGRGGRADRRQDDWQEVKATEGIREEKDGMKKKKKYEDKE